MRGSFIDRSIELENILELPNESGSEADDFAPSYFEKNGILLNRDISDSSSE
jgi:hypothetical protein